MRRTSVAIVFLFLSLQAASAASMQFPPARRISGVVVDHQHQALPGIIVIAHGASGERRTTTDDTGQFAIDVPDEEITLRVEGEYIKPQQQIVTTVSGNLRIE